MLYNIKEVSIKSFKTISVACLQGSINDCDTIERVSMKVKTAHMKYQVKQDPKFGSSPVSTGRVHRGFEVPRVMRQMDFFLNNQWVVRIAWLSRG